MTHDHTNALLAVGPVRQIETMLAANLQNLDQASVGMLANSSSLVLQQRIKALQMLLAQVRSDLQYVQPMLEAAQSVTQSFHTEMLADLASEEAKENEQRSREYAQKDDHIRPTWQNLQP